jgi:anthranilate synthase
MNTTRYLTAGGIAVDVAVTPLAIGTALEPVLQAINHRRGAVFSSGHEAPGRYSRWDIAFIDPPLEFFGRGNEFSITALNARGDILLKAAETALAGSGDILDLRSASGALRGKIRPAGEFAPEEERLRRPTLLSVVRALLTHFGAEGDRHLGLYGAFGYDLAFQYEPIVLRHARRASARDVHLYLPDELYVVDHRREAAELRRYEFSVGQSQTHGVPRTGKDLPWRPGGEPAVTSDHAPGEYAAVVEQVRAGCREGDFFEVVPSQVFATPYPGTPRELFENLRENNPSPYAFLLHLGDQHLVGASPEMYVRVSGRTVETCPISGTIARGRDALEDAEQIRKLLISRKDEAELTMCTDVDRNDKARVCIPGTVEVRGRRLIETYSRLFHTVDHVTGTLEAGSDALDAFAAHMWACTLTGAPKPAAMQRIEELERSPREWYGGAVGMLRFDGTLSTGITIRTLQLQDGIAKLRVGATLLYDSNPEEEEQETRLKAAAFLEAVTCSTKPAVEGQGPVAFVQGGGKRVLFVDNRDSFVHNLASYVRQCGAEVTTLRAGFPLEKLERLRPDLVFISPGPGRPADFGVPELVRTCMEQGLPIFGVCLGLQGMVEACGGKLGVLPEPQHGKPSTIACERSGIFAGFPGAFSAGRYHSLFAVEEDLPEQLVVTARSHDGVVMAIQHQTLPAAAVQFHPESILTLGERLGHRLIDNVVGLNWISRQLV